MKPGTDRTDAWPLLALLAGALLLAVNRLGASVSPDRLLGAAASAVPSLAPLALGAVAIASALASQRLITTRRTLRARRAVALVPVDEFDPKPDAVLGFTAQLARSQRSIAGWLDRRASAVWIRLSADGELPA